MRGISMLLPAEFRIDRLTLTLASDGVVPTLEASPPRLRTEVWPQWALEAIDGAVEARGHAALIPAAMVEPVDDDRLADLAVRELRASMRSLTATAFAVDGFYGAVKARSAIAAPRRARGADAPPRASQMAHLLGRELNLGNLGTKRLAVILRDLARYRGWAVHPVSAFRDPKYRPDLDAAVDWHFAAFRSGNAQHAAAEVALMLDLLAHRMEGARSEEVRGYAERATTSTAEIVAHAATAALQRNLSP